MQNTIKYNDDFATALKKLSEYQEPNRKTASWEKFGNGKSWACTNCRRGVLSRENYCPQCGSYMRGGQEVVF